MPTTLETLRTLDPVRDHQRIVFLSTRFDFPFDTTRALEFALFRTFAVPAISELLDRTGEFQQRAQKRYDDTDIIVSELMEWGYDSERGKAALRRMNQMHGRFAIANDDFLYVLSTFIFEPIRWNERFGWRLLCETERLGYFHFWSEVGRRMNIRAIPEGMSTYEEFNRDYERRLFRYTESNRRVGTATRELFVGWMPRLFAPLARSAIHALLDDPLRTAFGFPPPGPVIGWLTPASLKARATLLRLLPKRRRPVLHTESTYPTYPKGYSIDQLGPPGGDQCPPHAPREELNDRPG